MKKIEKIQAPSDITGLIPGVIGQRAFPTPTFKDSDPFLMLDHIGPQKVGADWQLTGEGHDHPHRGFETLTFVFEGKMNHRDSLGNRVQLNSGAVQRMNAGSGIVHGGSMFSDEKTERFHEIQLWINNPKDQKMSTPGIHNVSDHAIPYLEDGGTKLRVISGALGGLTGPINTLAPTQIGHVISKEAGTITVGTFDGPTKVMVYVMEGSASVAGTPILSTHLAQLTQEGSEVNLQMEANSQALILAGIPINEPVVYGGPFVMNTEEEIQQAHIDYQQGKFGVIEQ